MKKFDLIIIGGGAGAFAAAIRANELGAKTAMINAGLPWGGTCVNVGCVPSKALLWVGEVLNLAKHHKISGIELEVKNFDFLKVVQDELSLVEKLRREKYENVLKSLNHVTPIEGRARFVSQNKVEVYPVGDSENKRLAAEKFIIATGSTANVPLITGIREVGFLTHVEALRLKKLPRSLVVVGAGPAGLELSQMFARFGTKVTVLQRGPSIFPPAEEELRKRLHEVLTNEGIVIKTNVKVKSAKRLNSEKQITFEIDGQKESVDSEEILLTAGKTPNTQDLGLEKVGVELDKKQAVVVNQYFQTTNKNIFAVGDVASLPLRLETTAAREGTLAAENALRGSSYSIDYNTVPYTIFTDPQLAGVGITEKQQLKQLRVCSCKTVEFSKIPKAIIMRRTEGLIKMVIHPKTHQILGVHVLSPNASEIVAQAAILIKNKNTIEDAANSLPVFPTLSEAIKIVSLSFTKDISKLSCCI